MAILKSINPGSDKRRVEKSSQKIAYIVGRMPNGNCIGKFGGVVNGAGFSVPFESVGVAPDKQGDAACIANRRDEGKQTRLFMRLTHQYRKSGIQQRIEVVGKVSHG